MNIYGIVLTVFMMLETQSIVDIPTGLCEICIFFFVVLSSYENKWFISVSRSKENRFVLWYFLVPFLVIGIYSILVQIARGLEIDFLQHSFTLFVRFEVYMIFAVTCVKMFGVKTPGIFAVACAIAYLPAILKHFLTYDLGPGIYMLFMENAYSAQTALEVHTLTYNMGFATIYYFYRWLQYKDNVKKQFWICLLLTLMGLKRIVTLAIFVAIAMTIILHKMQRINEIRRYRLIIFATLIMSVAGLVYVQLIHSGVLELVLTKFGFKETFRFRFWNHFRNRYNLLPTYIGHGISYAARVMANEWRLIKGLGEVTNIHNDVLSMYLGIGFVGSILYWGIFFTGRVKRVWRDFSWKAACFLFVLSIYYFICMMMSNEGLTPLTHGVFFMMVFAMLKADKVKNDVEKVQRAEEGAG